MTSEEYRKAFSGLIGIQKRLNDIYLWSSIAVASLKEVESQDAAVNQISSSPFRVPSVAPKKSARRGAEDIKRILASAHSTELYKALVVYMVSLVEPVLMEMVRLTLLYDKRRVKTKPKGCDGKLDYDIVIDCADYSQVLDRIVSKYIETLEYSKPSDQLEYIKKLLSIEIDEDLWNSWVEIKASRDLIVHNNCIINKVYLDKAGDRARGDAGKIIKVDEAYFEYVIITAKRLVGKIIARVLRNLKS